MSAEQSLRSALLAIDEAIVRINKFMEDESQDSEVPDLFNRGKANEFLTLAKRHLDEAVQSDPNLTASIEKESGGCFIATAATGSIFLKRFWFCRSLDMVKICLNMKKIDSKRLEKAYRGK